MLPLFFIFLSLFVLSILAHILIVYNSKYNKEVIRFTLFTWCIGFIAMGLFKYPLVYKNSLNNLPGSGTNLMLEIPFDLYYTPFQHLVYFIVALLIYNFTKHVIQFKFLLICAVLLWYSYKYGQQFILSISNNSFENFMRGKWVMPIAAQYVVLVLSICIFKISRKNEVVKLGINDDILDELI